MATAKLTVDWPEPIPEASMESRPEGRLTIKERVLLSVTEDVEFDGRLRMSALERGQIVIRVDSIEAALRVVHADCCGAVLVDLDLAWKIGWEIADSLLRDPKCPPVILTAGPTEQSDLKMAVRAGSILEKAGETEGVLDSVQELLKASHIVQTERNAVQRGILRWLAPEWPAASAARAHRGWGINE